LAKAGHFSSADHSPELKAQFQAMRNLLVPACLGAGLLVMATCGEALAETAAETCLAANRSLSLGASLPRTAAHLKAGQSLKIVAVGSSSTTGLWMLRSDATYPAVMGREIAALRPAGQVEVINSGRIGDTVSGTMSRFASDVLAHHPDLIIWQLGTNDVAWGGRAGGLNDMVTSGVRTLKTSGADIVLMDMQYAPVVLASSEHETMRAIIAEVAREERIGLFSRFALMRRSVEAGLPSTALVAWDGLHNSEAGYDCVGRALARAIVNAAGR
jgi:acyl-CoA thioesterase-1